MTLRKITLKNKKGLTLLEIVVAIFIFTLMMATVAEIFVKLTSSYKAASRIQVNLESAQFAINLMTKTLRTSKIINTSPDLDVYDYSQGKCIRYSLSGTNLVSGWESQSSPADCSSFGSLNPIASHISSFSFDPKKSADSPKSMGRVVISLKVCANDSCSGDQVTIQSGVSLRDYKTVTGF